MSHNRNNTLDIIKLFASYWVVFIHVRFYGNMGIVIDALARFAVPLFFTISGFYSYSLTPKQISKRITHILRLLILSVTIYVVWSAGLLFVRQGTQGLAQFISYYLDVANLLKLFLFNLPLSASHLWYLLAILYVYVLYYIVTVFDIRKELIIAVSIFLLLLHIILGEVLAFFKIIVPYYYLRNFALMGIPFFGLGLFVYSHKNRFLNVPNHTIIVLLAAGILETIASRCYFGKNELYIGSLFILVAIIVVFIKYPNITHPHTLIALAGCSTYIYVFHPLVSSTILRGYSLIHINYKSSVLLQTLHPLITCLITTCFVYILDKIAKQLKRYIHIHVQAL